MAGELAQALADNAALRAQIEVNYECIQACRAGIKDVLAEDVNDPEGELRPLVEQCDSALASAGKPLAESPTVFTPEAWVRLCDERDEAEKALRALGYEKHGIGWAIVIAEPGTPAPTEGEA